MDFLILAINPGSTSTKIALFENERQLFKESIPHPQQELEQYNGILAQIPMRQRLVLECLANNGFAPQRLSAVVGRGGLLPPVKTGGYRVNQTMLDLILGGTLSPHASNLGAVLASDIAAMANAPAFIYDAVSASEFPPVAKITGMPEVERKSFYHVLNTRAAGMRYAETAGARYEDLNLLIAHLGGGITMGAHLKGKIVDSLADDSGPFAPERAGSVPLLDVIDMCYSGRYRKAEMVAKVRGRGGLRALLGTSDGREIEHMVERGDERANLVMQAQAYQIAKGIALMAPALRGVCDAVILTGGLAHNSHLVAEVEGYVAFLGPVVVMPGEFEMEALARGALRILRGQEDAHEM